MADEEVQQSRAFVTAAQSLQHLETNARLGDAKHEAGVSLGSPTQVYQQAPREDQPAEPNPTAAEQQSSDAP